jgi:simple sugar transport system ATP-binding protein
LAICALIGLINGYITLQFAVPSFITTLGMLFIARSLTVVISGGFPPLLPDDLPTWLFTDYIWPGSILRMSFVWFAGIALLAAALLSLTNFGNWIRATGGFNEAAASMGIPVRRVKIICFMLCSMLAGFAGLLQVLRLGSPLPSIGEGLELQAVAAAVIGGTALARRHRHRPRRHHRRAAHPRHRQRPRPVARRCELVQVRDRAADHVRGDRQCLDGQDVAQDQGGGTQMTSPVIECRNLQKWYSGVHALKNVSLTIQPGESVGLVGDNGAGKSTLIKILSGVHRQDSGQIRIEGKDVDFRSPKDAMHHGLETIYQYNSMVPTMSIARNLFIGREPLKWRIGNFGLIDQKRMRAESVRAIADVDLHLRSPDALVGELSGGQRQGVAIARAMHFKSKVLILDEPTNHLSVKETNKVIGFVRGLKAQGLTGIFISHNIQHVFQSCDRIVAMARGEIVFDQSDGRRHSASTKSTSML